MMRKPSGFQRPSSASRYALQGEDDPSLIILASDIWFSEDYTSSPLSRGYEARLLRLLESGSRVLPAIRESLTPLVSARGEWVQFDPREAEAIVAFFERKRRGQMRLGEAVGLGLGGQVPGANLPVDEVRADGRIAEICSHISALRGDLRVPTLATPGGFNGRLRPYQARGVSWLIYLRNLGFGACLADDMGLGKTIELLA